MQRFAASARLTIDQVPGDFNPAELLPAFNTNPAFLQASGHSPEFSLGEVQAYLLEETQRENSCCLLIRLRETHRTIGTAALLVPKPSDGLPWIGLLILESLYQGGGLGAEATLAIEARLALGGWPSIRLYVLQENSKAIGFWRKLGYELGAETQDSSGRPSRLMEKRIFPESQLRGG